MSPSSASQVTVIGAGPAGLTAALLAARSGRPVTVLEATGHVGGLARTVERDGWRFDLGGHRFFTKVPEVRRLWREILPGEDFLRRPRLSRILYRGRLFDYPLKPLNALRRLGVAEAVLCMLSYVAVRVRPPRDQSNFEGWVSARFGRRLYRIFFKTYTEKVWGAPATSIQADWAAQRIKDLSLSKAVAQALRPGRTGTRITTLIDEFEYPRLGPGMMWERARELAERAGARVLLDSPVVRVERAGDQAAAVMVERAEGTVRHPCEQLISSMPLPELVLAMNPPPPPRVVQAARQLSYRDFLTVALVVPVEAGFPDNWIYVHTPGVRVGRVQNFGSWSPHLVKDGCTCLGMEYFVNEGDELWSLPDDELVGLARRELAAIGLIPDDRVRDGYVVRVPKAYPVYDRGYQERVAVLRDWLARHARNVQAVGRNGMHKYNNQDHSMLTAMLAVENLDGADHDLWAVNVEADYHEEGTTARHGTGRSAPSLSSGPPTRSVGDRSA